MPEWIIAMFLIGALLSAGDMAKIFLEARRSRREAAVYDNHPQKLQMEHYADSFRVLAESFYQMPSKSVMPETGRVDKILEKEQQEVCSRCAKASWCWEQYGNLTRERCQELLQTIADGDEDEIRPHITAVWGNVRNGANSLSSAVHTVSAPYLANSLAISPRL